MFCCLKTCRNSIIRTTAAEDYQENVHQKIHLDPLHIGPDVVLLSNFLRITGSGGALCTAPLVQSKSYFEIKIQQRGSWSVGLATQQTDLSQKVGGRDKSSWCLCSDNATRHNNEEYRPVVAAASPIVETNPTHECNGNDTNKLIGIETDEPPASPSNFFELFKAPKEHLYPDEGDVVGVAFDHIELNFTFNGKSLEVPFRNVKGTVFPVVYVDDGAILDIILDKFVHAPPPSFEKIMLEQSLL